MHMLRPTPPCPLGCAFARFSQRAGPNSFERGAQVMVTLPALATRVISEVPLSSSQLPQVPARDFQSSKCSIMATQSMQVVKQATWEGEGELLQIATRMDLEGKQETETSPRKASSHGMTTCSA